MNVSDDIKNTLRRIDEAAAAVEEAKKADQAAKDALAKANNNGLITPTEVETLNAAQQNAVAKKTAATNIVNQLPAAYKGDMPTTLAGLTGIDIPSVTDQNENGIADDYEAALTAVEAAMTADEDVKAELVKANEDGLITPTEKAELERLQQDVVDKKAAATEKVNVLPEKQKGDMPTTLAGLTGIDIPSVTDQNENGIADDYEAALTAVEAAMTADEDVKAELVKANEDGLITPTEKAELERLQQDVVDKKAAAEEIVNALQEDQKGILPAELEKLEGITIPKVNDSDANGVDDEVDAQRDAAKAAVEEAKVADQAAKDALAELSKDGLITPEEKKGLEKLQQAAVDKKTEATDKVEALPAEQKGELPTELSKLDGIEIPDINDNDANGVADEVDEQRKEAKAAVEAAVEAAKVLDQAAKDTLAELSKDGLITPTEKAELEKLQQDAADKKAAATEKVDALPEDQKGNLPSELDKLDGITIPEVNDSDENGIADNVDAQRADAEKAVEEAKKADKAAKDALAKAQADGIITAEERAELERLQKDAQVKKATATEKVEALPADQKGDLLEELDKLTGIKVPEVTDIGDSDKPGDHSDTENKPGKDTKSGDKQEKPDGTISSPMKPTEKDNDTITEDGETIEKETPSQIDSEGKKQTLHELPKTGQDSQQPITLFGGLITALGGLLFFRRRKKEKESK
ncbi:LPXTG cell wall anchor domain-containing protein [Staphylococcus sp. IVB6227]|uniref:LPXTG cell wall anchor domain-containing protein n=1 Tax=Staphylococcus sp. IVB6227 TaxID=2989768 RepID=UPI0021CFCFEE|nr:LPXTG cell wall anchor domain-containing protein [Staphylococcus sp. IVB6227]UXR78491.1 LPXTG cell wall anchor domain-containing protein [Staphylococcus sp. IVB6227]